MTKRKQACTRAHTPTHTYLTPHRDSSQAWAPPLISPLGSFPPPETWCLPHLVGARPGILPKGGLVHMKALRGCRKSETREAMDQGLHCSGLLNELPLVDIQTGLGCGKEARVPEPLHFPGEVATSGKGHKKGRTFSGSGPQCPCWNTEKGRYSSRGQMGKPVRQG